LSSDSLVLSPVELDYSQDDLMVSSLSSFDYDTSTCVSLDLVRPLGLQKEEGNGVNTIKLYYNKLENYG